MLKELAMEHIQTIVTGSIGTQCSAFYIFPSTEIKSKKHDHQAIKKKL